MRFSRPGVTVATLSTRLKDRSEQSAPCPFSHSTPVAITGEFGKHSDRKYNHQRSAYTSGILQVPYGLQSLHGCL